MLESVSSYLSTAPTVEIGALASGLAYVVLAARGNVWCWPAGIVASVLSLAVALSSNYRLDVLKEAYYIGMGFYGWWVWTRTTDTQADRPIVVNSLLFNCALIVGAGGLSLIVGYYFSTIGSSLPYLDAATTVFAFSTTWLVARKVLENWLYWIVINVAGIVMYTQSGAYFFSLLLAVYTIVAVVGFIHWRQLYMQQASPPAAANAPAEPRTD